MWARGGGGGRSGGTGRWEPVTARRLQRAPPQAGAQRARHRTRRPGSSCRPSRCTRPDPRRRRRSPRPAPSGCGAQSASSRTAAPRATPERLRAPAGHDAVATPAASRTPRPGRRAGLAQLVGGGCRHNGEGASLLAPRRSNLATTRLSGGSAGSSDTTRRTRGVARSSAAAIEARRACCTLARWCSVPGRSSCSRPPGPPGGHRLPPARLRRARPRTPCRRRSCAGRPPTVDRIEVPEAWLTKVLTNLCLNQLTSARARRETYVGQWLPEPLLAGDPMLGPADTAEQRESVSYAVLTLMERLSPNERAVYVLREAFDYPHREIAEILDITEAASQQIFHRAKKHVADGQGPHRDRRGRRPADRRGVPRGRRQRPDRAARAAAHRRTPSRSATAAGRSRPAPRRSRARSRSRSSCGACSSPREAKRAIVGGSPEIYAWTANGDPAVVAVARRPGRRRHVPGGHRRGHRRAPQPGQPRQARTRDRASGRPPTTGTPVRRLLTAM